MRCVKIVAFVSFAYLCLLVCVEETFKYCTQKIAKYHRGGGGVHQKITADHDHKGGGGGLLFESPWTMGD